VYSIQTSVSRGYLGRFLQIPANAFLDARLTSAASVRLREPDPAQQDVRIASRGDAHAASPGVESLTAAGAGAGTGRATLAGVAMLAFEVDGSLEADILRVYLVAVCALTKMVSTQR
jgi:hypothetical protein